MQLIFLPGMACDASVWRRQLAAVPAQWNAVVSDVHFRFDTVEQMAAALLNESAHTELVLCGASMGGMIAMEAARQSPARVAGLALLGTSARPETPDIQALREAAIELYAQGRAEEVLLANLKFAFHPDAQANAAITNEYLRVILAAGADQLVRQNRAVIKRPDARQHLARVRCPALVMWGDSDQLTPPECAREIASLIAHSKAVEISHCGHMLTMERPDKVTAQLLGWLEGLRAT
jgi:pimeloyl-ACP methyl ester carboxylesterase